MIESRDVEGRQPPTVILSNPDFATAGGTGLYWLPDGRLMYSLAESPPNQKDSNLWAVRVDPVKGGVVANRNDLLTGLVSLRAGSARRLMGNVSYIYQESFPR